MTVGEARFRARSLARMQAQRLTCRLRPPRWDRTRLRDLLSEQAGDDARQALERRAWLEAHGALARVMNARASRFVLDPRAGLGLTTAILGRWPDAADRAAAHADRLLAGRYDLLGYRDLSFTSDGETDWHLDPVHGRRAPQVCWADVPYLNPACGDHKIIWELNRQQHWHAWGRALWLTGDRRYADAILSQLSGWMAANPPLVGVNWASMLELALRAISWTSALHFLLAHDGPAEEPWLVDLLLGLDRQLTHVEANLSQYFSPNTHLLGEALALYVVGYAVPELSSSARWIEIGRTVLLAEIDRQIGEDGGHAERSTHYHRYALDFYLLALLTARRNDDSAATGAFTGAVTRLGSFMRSVADPRGHIALIGDDDGGELWPMAGRSSRDVTSSLAAAAVVLGRPDLQVGELPEDVFWLAWSTGSLDEGLLRADVDSTAHEYAAALPGSQPISTQLFPDTGYAVVRDRDDHLMFDVGQHGYLNGGHAHADALAITLSLEGRTLLIDPGTATYTMDAALRDRMRSSLSHNTLTIDRRSSSVPAGPFHWATRTDARLDASRANRGFAWLEASHVEPAPVRHRRSIVHAGPDGWLVVDEVLGRDRHEAQLHWHFDPAWSVTCESNGRLRAIHADGTTAWLLHDGRATWLMQADEESGLGWCSPAYGSLVPAWTARATRAAAAPFALISWIGHGSAIPSLERLRTECDPGAAGIACRVTQGERAHVTLLRPGEPALRDTRSCTVGEYHTNARLLQYGTRGGRIESLTAADTSHVLALRDGWISVAADDHVQDLHVESAGECLSLWSATPPSRLHLQGEALLHAATLRLNGRELPVSQPDRRDSLLVLGASWAEADRRPELARDASTPHADASAALCVE